MSDAIDRARRFVRPAIYLALLTALLVPYFTSEADATHQPADKVVAAADTVQVDEPNDGQRVELLRATMKTSKPTDLILQLSMECSIITEVTTGPLGGTTYTEALATGQVRAWIEIDDAVVPINSIGDAEPGDTTKDGVTFCSRVHEQTASEGEDPPDGLDRYTTYLETKAANSFNWLRLNMGSGQHEIVVWGELTTNEMAENQDAEAYIGNRSLIVEPAKLANDATI